MLFITLNREDFSFVIHLDRQPRTSRRREAQTGSRARSGSRSERTLDAVEHSRTLMEWWPFLIFHRGGLRIKVINNKTPPNCRRVLRECHAYLSPNFNNEFEQTMSIRVSTQGVRERESSRSCSNRRSSPNRRRALDLLKSATGMHTNGRRNVPDCRRQGDQKSHGSCWRARLESAQSDRPHRTEIRKRVKQKALTQLKSAG